MDWDINREKQANIAANAHGGSWDEEKLNELLKELSEMPEFDIDLTGFDTSKLDEILLDYKNELAEEDEIPDINQTITQVGDHYTLGNKHRVLCGDSTDINNIDRLLNGEKAGMLFTDPPYGINAVRGGKLGGEGRIQFGRTRQPGGRNGLGCIGGKNRVKPRIYKKIINDDKPFDPTFLLNLAPVIILWGANCYASKLLDSYGWIVWDKEIPPGTNFSACELAWVNKGNHVRKYTHRWSGMCRAGNRKEELKDRIHPTQKPVGLIAEIFKDYPYNPVLDLFLGSGSTLIAAEKMNRICYGMELDPYYVDLTITRLCKYAGIKKVIKNNVEIEWPLVVEDIFV